VEVVNPYLDLAEKQLLRALEEVDRSQQYPLDPGSLVARLVVQHGSVFFTPFLVYFYE
jgi:hypothetical protein